MTWRTLSTGSQAAARHPLHDEHAAGCQIRVHVWHEHTVQVPVQSLEARPIGSFLSVVQLEEQASGPLVQQQRQIAAPNDPVSTRSALNPSTKDDAYIGTKMHVLVLGVHGMRA